VFYAPRRSGGLVTLVTPLARQPISCYYYACDLSYFDVVLCPSSSQILATNAQISFSRKPRPPQCSLPKSPPLKILGPTMRRPELTEAQYASKFRHRSFRALRRFIAAWNVHRGCAVVQLSSFRLPTVDLHSYTQQSQNE